MKNLIYYFFLVTTVVPLNFIGAVNTAGCVKETQNLISEILKNILDHRWVKISFISGNFMKNCSINFSFKNEAI